MSNPTPTDRFYFTREEVEKAAFKAGRQMTQAISILLDLVVNDEDAEMIEEDERDGDAAE